MKFKTIVRWDRASRSYIGDVVNIPGDSDNGKVDVWYRAMSERDDVENLRKLVDGKRQEFDRKFFQTKTVNSLRSILRNVMIQRREKKMRRMLKKAKAVAAVESGTKQ